MENLAEIVKKAVFEYAGGGVNLETYALADDNQQVYSVLAVDVSPQPRYTGIVVLARVSGDQVIIEADHTNHPLFEVLEKRGISPEQIVCAYSEN